MYCPPKYCGKDIYSEISARFLKYPKLKNGD
jgi:hypothetical protein